MHMRNIVIAVVVSTVVVGGVLLVFLGDKSASPVIPPEPAAGVDQAKPADLAPGARRVQTVPATPKELVRLEVAVVNDKNEPVANARVRIDSEEALKSGRRNPAPVAEFLTNASGLGAPKDKLLVGTYVVWAEASGYARARKVATLVKGEEPVKVVITLASGVAISGRVFTKDRTPIKGARVTAFKDLGKQDGTDFDWLLDLLNPERLKKPLSVAETDADGVYQLVNLELGVECVVRAAADGYAPGTRNFVAAGTPNVDFYLESGARLIGEVLAANGAPVGGALIEAYQRSGSATTDLRVAVAGAMRGAVDTVKAGGDGRFEFSALGQGSFTLVASAPAHQEAMQDVELRLGMETPVAITLPDGVLLAGKVVGPGGAAVPNAKVAARPQASVSGGANALNREVDKETATDGSGLFAFDSLSSGQYTLTVSHDQFAAAQLRDVDVPQDGVQIALGEGASIEGSVTDAEGAPIAGVRVSVTDVGTVSKEAVSGEDGRYLLGPLSVKPINKKQVTADKEGWAKPEPKTVTLTEGTVAELDFVLQRTARIGGVVKDTAGKPIDGVKVLVEKMITRENPVHRFLDFAYTGADGSFDLPKIVPSNDVRLVAEHRYYIRWLSEPFSIDAGEDFPETEIVMEVGSKISGEVVNEAGQRLEGAQVKAVRAGDPDTHDFLGGGSTKTDAQGRFQVQGLGSGSYEIVAQLNDYIDGRSEPLDMVEGASRSGVKVKLVAARSVSGTVTDMQRRPVAGARVTAIDTSMGARKESNVTDEQGRFTVGNLGVAPVELQAEADGYGKQTLHDVAPGGSGVEIRLLALGGVKGNVIDTDGNPVKAFSARAEPIDVDAGYETPRAAFKTFSGAEGGFEIPNLPPGSYTINVQSPGYRGTQAANIRVAAADVTDVGVLRLQTGGILNGRVIDSYGAPVPDATVAVIGGASRLPGARGGASATTTTTDADGRFSFEGLKGGATKFRVSKPGYLASDSESVDPNTLVSELVLRLGVGGVISGVVINGSGQPLPNVKVYLKGEPKSAQTETDSRGHFVFDALPEGVYTVRTFTFAKPGEERRVEPVLDVEVSPGGVVEVELVKE
jgi:uncharacterized GH25 family protein